MRWRLLPAIARWHPERAAGSFVLAPQCNLRDQARTRPLKHVLAGNRGSVRKLAGVREVKAGRLRPGQNTTLLASPPEHRASADALCASSVARLSELHWRPFWRRS